MPATGELKRLDGLCACNRWHISFNSIHREKTYHTLNLVFINHFIYENGLYFHKTKQRLHGCLIVRVLTCYIRLRVYNRTDDLPFISSGLGTYCATPPPLTVFLEI